MFNKIKKISVLILTILELVLLVGIKYIETLARSKAGVNHHLHFKKTQYMRTVFTDPNIKLMLIAGFFVLVVAIVILVLAQKKKNSYLVLGAVSLLIWDSSILYGLKSTSLIENMAYPYIMMIFAVNLIIAIITSVLAWSIKSK